VHAKIGHRNALVWVTDLATGLPVEGARVRLYRGDVTKMTAEPAATVRAFLDDKPLGTACFDDVRAGALELTRPIGAKDPGREATLKIEKQGPGRLYYAARLLYSPLQLKTERINSGIEVKREYSVERGGEWVLLKDPMTLRPGELVPVDLYLSLPAPRNFVVVDDPVPGGLEPVNRDLATASQVDAEKAEVRRSRDSFWFTRDDWFAFESSHWSFYHRELRHHAAGMKFTTLEREAIEGRKTSRNLALDPVGVRARAASGRAASSSGVAPERRTACLRRSGVRRLSASAHLGRRR
jgi:hypothetical protein